MVMLLRYGPQVRIAMPPVPRGMGSWAGFAPLNLDSLALAHTLSPDRYADVVHFRAGVVGSVAGWGGILPGVRSAAMAVGEL